MTGNPLVLTFGEIMMRLSPKDHLRIEQATEFDVRYGGAEANAALSLSYQGDRAAYVSVVPANRLGDCALRSLSTWGVDTTRVVRAGDRLGAYVFEVGASVRGNGCVYDRKYSAINLAERDIFDWDSILDGVGVFYFSGVTPAISENMALACADALKACRERGIVTVCDVNYRGKMWSPERSQQVMRELLPLVDIYIAMREFYPLMPATVGLLGFDNTEWAGVANPAPAIIVQPALEEGRQAARLLIDLIEGGNDVERHQVLSCSTQWGRIRQHPCQPPRQEGYLIPRLRSSTTLSTPLQAGQLFF